MKLEITLITGGGFYRLKLGLTKNVKNANFNNLVYLHEEYNLSKSTDGEMQNFLLMLGSCHQNATFFKDI